MKLFTVPQYDALLNHGKSTNRGKDYIPVAKLFLPGTGCTWLLTELDPENPNIAFGLCDLGMGFPELGYVDLDEITSVKSCLGLSVEADYPFIGIFPLSIYAAAARHYEQIIENEAMLKQFIQY